MIVTPSLSVQLLAASAERYCRATGWLRTTLALASMKPRTTSSGVAPASGASGSMPTELSEGSATCVISTVAELEGTVLQPASSASIVAAGAASRRILLTSGSPGGAGPVGAAAAV